eukprot:TRINITY_DN20223_c0_g1_i3.p1 TRINITY_DN20223_c0_g1~~TRINITY_DN20223_c0_g1_i3.p1  ORF type:complete len:407 (-),score=168.81 TRINITY_DN20223_c0_g1_i3:117-1304(-)
MSEEEYYEEGEEEEDEEVDEEEEEENEEKTNQDETRTTRSGISEGEEKLRARNEAKKGELDEQLRDVINEWRKQRAKEEEELKKLKDQQARRKEIRAEQEKKLAEQKKEEEERIRKEESEKKAREAEEKRKRLEEAEKKRQGMVQAQKDKHQAGGYGSSDTRKGLGGFASVQDAKREIVKTKEQLADEKKISLSIRIKPLTLDDLGKDGLKSKASELWENVIRLETEKYDLEERQKRQHWDLKELSERQTQRLRLKAVRLGLDAEALTGKYPPKIQTTSKFERRADNKSYEDKKTLFDGGWEILSCEFLEKEWKEKMGDWNKQQKTKLPKWFGVRPGKKSGEPATPEDEDEGKADSLQDVDEDFEDIGNIEDVDEEAEEEDEEYEEDEEEEDEEE